MFNSPLLLGFDHFKRMLDRVSKTAADGYPPYNVEQFDENHLRITLVVAGLTAGDLNVSIEDNQLVIRGKEEDERGHTYLHHGVAARRFQRSFVLAEGIEVTAATLSGGLLNIDLVRPQPESRRRTIEIHPAEDGSESLSVASADETGSES